MVEILGAAFMIVLLLIFAGLGAVMIYALYKMAKEGL